VETYSTVEEYDPATDTWTSKSDMPTARGNHSANVVDGNIYVIGGSHASTPDRNHVRTVEVYDPATDTWTQKGEMPRPIGAGFSSVVDGKIYVIGGYGGSRRVDEYDPVTDTWTQKSDMPTKRHALSTSALDGKIYAIGGYVPGVSGYPGVATVEVYDPATDTWTTAPDMPTGRFGARTSIVDGKVYVIGGMEYWIGSAYRMVEEYDPL
jgi:N-acetylneuraminic acid mutarotase